MNRKSSRAAEELMDGVEVYVRGATKVFEAWGRSCVALEGVQLDVRAGSTAVLFGSNGSGKTTLLRAIRGQVPLDEGQVLLGGRDVLNMSSRLLASTCGYVQQAPLQNLCGAFTVKEMVQLYLGRSLAERQGEVLSRLIDKKRIARETRVRELSGGQQQLLALELVLARRPRLLLLDEPTASLDSRHARDVLDRVAEAARRGVTIVFVSHNIQHGLLLADVVVVLHRGAILRTWQGDEVRGLKEKELSEILIHMYRAQLVEDPSMPYGVEVADEGSAN